MLLQKLHGQTGSIGMQLWSIADKDHQGPADLLLHVCACLNNDLHAAISRQVGRPKQASKNIWHF